MIRKKERSNRLCFIRLNYSLLTVVEIPLIRIACDTFSAGKYKGIRYLDVTTVYTKEKNSVIINVVNRHKDKAVTTEIVNQSGNFSGKPSVTEVTANDLSEGFSFYKQISLHQKRQRQWAIKLFIHFHLILLHRSS